jgi:hypothetical protein
MDLMDVMDALKRVNAQSTLDDLNVAVMSNTTDAEGFRKFSTGLQKQAGIDTEPGGEKFDQSGFERLKMKMKLGI